MKHFVLGALLLLVGVGAFAAEPVNDAAAIQVLDHMSAMIGELGSCSYVLDTSSDVVDPDHGLMTHLGTHRVCMVGPNKMQVDSRTDAGHRGYWYDGKTVTYYSYDENNFSTIKGAKDILGTIEAVNRDYGVDFPAADFFYPSFTDDLIDHTDEIRYVGLSTVNGIECLHIIGRSKTTLTQFWFANDASTLPVRYSITQIDKEGAPQYVATFSEWKLNPTLPNSLFDFVPPRSAREVKILAKSGK